MDEGKQRKRIDDANRVFWEELCGSTLARDLGIKNNSIESLKKYDKTYMDYYPYLLKHVPVQSFRGKHILEIGLGYGTLSQKIAESGAIYTGIDIAAAPVSIVNRRLNINMLPGEARQINILNNDFQDHSFDIVVSIGCFHHTGSVQKCVDESWRLLKPKGVAYIMVYNRYSYRQWFRWPLKTLRSTFTVSIKELPVCKNLRYDKDTNGNLAPETVFLSIKELTSIFSQYSRIDMIKENWGGVSFRRLVVIPRKPFLNILGHVLGLDIYIKARK